MNVDETAQNTSPQVIPAEVAVSDDPKIAVPPMPPKPGRPPKLQPIVNPGGFSERDRVRGAQKLGKRLPTGFVCKPDCSACCETPVTMLGLEWLDMLQREPMRTILAAHKAAGTDIKVELQDQHGVRVSTDKGVCPFLDGATKKCGIYSQRPFVCRAYGQHWIFWCKEAVECPPEAEVADRRMTEWATLAGLPYGGMPPERMEGVRVLVEMWRAEEPGKRLDKMPTYAEMAARFRVPEDAPPPAVQPLA